MKKLIAILLSLLLMCSVALPAFAIIYGDEDDPYTDYGIAKGYVRTKEVSKSEGSTHTIARTFNKQGKVTKETDTWKSEGYTDKTIRKYTYDKKGRLTKEVDYLSDSISTTTYAYNKAGNVTQETRVFTYEDGSSSTTKSTYAYDQKGNKIKEVTYLNDHIVTTTSIYDKKGRLTKETVVYAYENTESFTTVTTYTYDKAGNEIKRVTKSDNVDGVTKSTVTCVYDEKGRLIKYTEAYSYSQETSKEVITYTYDKNGNKIKEVDKQSFGDGGKATRTVTSTYDEKGNLIKEVYTDKTLWGSSKNTISYVYDGNGRLKKETRVYKDGNGTEKTVQSLTYDKAGNLIKVVFTVQPAGDAPASKEVTTYTYQKIGT